MGILLGHVFSLLLIIGTATAFLTGTSTRGWHNRRTAQSSVQMASATVGENVERNIFHEYDKPILLVGCSGEGDEMKRLAKSLQASILLQNSPDAVLMDLSDLTSDDNDDDDVYSSIEEGKYKWPTVIVADFSETETSMQSKYMSAVEKLYEQTGLLSIFVNVDPEGGKMKAETQEIKSQLEEGVFIKNSDYELCIKDEGNTDSEGWEHIEWELARLLARARLVPAVPGATTPTVNTAHLTMGENSFFLSLSFPSIEQVEPYVEEMCVDVDAMEYRTDLLDCRDSRFDLIYGMQLLRRYCRSYVVRVPALPFCGQVLEDVMPIVYTVRTQNQAGTYPDDEAGIDKMFDMLEWGLRGGVEVLDVESAWDEDKINALLSLSEQRYSSQILGSHHVVGKEISSEEAVRLFQQCALGGRAHGAKVVLSIDSEDKDRMAHEAALMASSLAKTGGEPVIPNISLILGDVGKFSRIINMPFTPVTHESLPFKAAPGQMSASELMAARLLFKIYPTRRYAILGHNIAYSVSPQMQGAAFAAVRLPHLYSRMDVETVDEFIESDFFQAASFGGCSVTIPHKQAIMEHVDVLSDAAEAIGSVNTLIAENEIVGEEFERVIYGDNTDWKGIFNPLERKIGIQNDATDATGYALILGGGGTARAAAYAASKLGLRRIYFNRTPSKAAALAETFGGEVAENLDSSDEPGSLGSLLGGSVGNLKVVISTLPAGVGFVLPDWVLDGDGQKPVIFDVNYKPFHTKLLSQAEEAGCDVVRGSEMLWEQGVGQFEAWTKRTAPYNVMKAVVLNNCLPEDESD